MAITNSNQLKESIDIVDVISNYIELKKSGANFKALCPFHGEKTASFVVSPSKQIYHCFSCGVGGDSIKFVQEYNKLSFPEAVEKIASDHNFTLEYKDNHDSSKYRTYEVINSIFSEFIVKNLRDSEREYLYGRGFSDETIEKWGIGYCPRGSDDIIGAFSKNFIPLFATVELGVLGEDKGRVYTPFSSRLCFPVKNSRGKIVGFVGRDLTNKSKAKYKNSKESALFSKSKLLFGFDVARESILKDKREKKNLGKKRWLIIEEGQFDVMLSHQVGVTNSCGLQGTALTIEHIKMIKNLDVKVLLATDGDRAGLESAFKSAVLLSQNGIDGGVAIFAEGDDPADMIASGRVDEFKNVLKKGTKLRLIEFVLKQIADRTDMRGPFKKSEGVGKCMQFLGSLDPIVAGHYRAMVNSLFGVDAPVFVSLAPCSPVIVPSLDVAIPTATLEDNILFTLYSEPWYLDDVSSLIEPKAFSKADLLDLILNNNIEAVEDSGLELLRDINVLSLESLILALKQIKKRYLKWCLGNVDIQKAIGISLEIKQLGD